MELTFDYEDIKEIFETIGITINDVYFAASAVSPTNISVYMYWISPANQFNSYLEMDYICGLSMQVKGKWFDHDEFDKDAYDDIERLEWINRQAYVNCRYFIDGTGTGSIGSHGLINQH
jgi:hypothetical protein